MSDFNNIPISMRQLPKWVLWRHENGTKIPYSVNGGRASVTDSSTWATFDNAVSNIGWNNGIAFVLTADDPFTIIDYDEECPQEVIDTFDTYTERSQSGRGVHIILNGSFDSDEKKRVGKVECYQEARYMIMTGDVVKDRPIANRQEELEQWRADHGLAECTKGTSITQVVTYRDVGELDDILDRMRLCSNTERALDLYDHGYQVGADRSAEDAHLMESLRFYAGGDKEKTFALMWQSACVRDKWNRPDYLERTWTRFSNQPVYEPKIQVDELMEVPLDFCERMQSPEFQPWQDLGMPLLTEQQYSPDSMGVLSDICTLFNETSPKPIPSFAMHTALATIGTYLGRRFKTVSGNYTSLFWGVIGKTGCGKGHTMKIINHVITELDPALSEIIQGSGYTSDSAIFSTLQKSPSHIGFIDELGDYIQGSRSGNNSTANAQWRVLKEIWANSGTVRPRNYSDHTVRQKSNAQLHCVCPNLSLFGASTVSQFWSSLSIKDGADGFLNRWLVYTDDSMATARRRIIDLDDFDLPESLRSWHETICKRSPIRMKVMGSEDGETVAMVSGDPTQKPDPVTLEWAEGAEDLFYHYQVDVIDPCCDDTLKYEMMQRAAQMARCIALIVELSVDPWAEFVSASSCMWAIEYVNTVLCQMSKYAKRHIAGNEEEALALKLLDAIRKSKKGLTKKEMQALKIEEFTARNFKDAITRLIDGELITKTNRKSGRGRPQAAYVAIESEKDEEE